MPEVSVIVPTFNRAHLIMKAIYSVLGQTFKDLEVIVVDDGSKDNTSTLVLEINDIRLKYIRHAQQKGASEARNTGVAASSGKFLAFLDDDDEWMPDKLKLQMEIFREKPDTGMVYSGYYYINSKNNKIFREFHPKKSGLLDDDLLTTNCVGTTSTAVIRRDSFEKAGGFDVSLRGCQDWDLWIRLAKFYPLNFADKPLVNFLIHDIRITHDLNAKIQGKERLLNKIFPLIQHKSKILSAHYFVIGKLYCSNGDIENGKNRILKAITTYPFKINYYLHYLPCLVGLPFYKSIASMKRKILSAEENLN